MRQDASNFARTNKLANEMPPSIAAEVQTHRPVRVESSVVNTCNAGNGRMKPFADDKIVIG